MTKINLITLNGTKDLLLKQVNEKARLCYTWESPWNMLGKAVQGADSSWKIYIRDNV